MQHDIDDEYAKAGMYDPKVCVTTSHDPSSRLKQFAKVRERRTSIRPVVSSLQKGELLLFSGGSAFVP